MKDRSAYNGCRVRRRILKTLRFVTICLLVSGPAHSAGPDTLLGSKTATSDHFTGIAWSGPATDRALAVWYTGASTLCPPGPNQPAAIRGRIVDANKIGVEGDPAGAFFTIAGNADGTGTMHCPAVTWNDTRARFLAVWLETAGAEWAIRSREIATDGTLSAVQTVYENAASSGRHPMARYNSGTSEYVVAYGTQSGSATQPTLCKSATSATGTWTCTSTVELSSNLTDIYPALAVKPGTSVTSRYFLTWKVTAMGTSRIRGVMLDGALAETVNVAGATGEFDVSSTSDPQTISPTIAYQTSGGTGQFLAGWQATIGDGANVRTQGRMLRDTGCTVPQEWCWRGVQFLISPIGGALDHKGPTVVPRVGGIYVAGWTASDNRVSARTVSFNGTTLGTVTGPDYDTAPVAAVPDNPPGRGTAIVAHTSATLFGWSDTRVAANNREVYLEWFVGDATSSGPTASGAIIDDFLAETIPDGIQVSWRSEEESQLILFELDREENGFSQTLPELIPTAGANGTAYVFVDSSGTGTSLYTLWGVGVDGEREYLAGPITADDEIQSADRGGRWSCEASISTPVGGALTTLALGLAWIGARRRRASSFR